MKFEHEFVIPKANLAGRADLIVVNDHIFVTHIAVGDVQLDARTSLFDSIDNWLHENCREAFRDMQRVMQPPQEIEYALAA